jgi:hypothetical protein
MKLKLNHNEFRALLQMYVGIVLPFHPTSLATSLVQHLQMQIYEKLYKSAIAKKANYTIKMTPAEALSFYAFWHQHQFENPASYEANLIRQTNNSIHQKLIV